MSRGYEHRYSYINHNLTESCSIRFLKANFSDKPLERDDLMTMIRNVAKGVHKPSDSTAKR